jgi:hypothetical protein
MAGTDVTVAAGSGVLLISSVTAIAGDVSVTSKAGAIDLSAETLSLNALAGSVDVVAAAGLIKVNDILAGKAITLDAAGTVSLVGEIDSSGGNVSVTSRVGDLNLYNGATQVSATIGDVTLKSLTGVISTPAVLSAGGDLTITSFGTLQLNDEIASSGGDITATSTSGGIILATNLNAAGVMSLTAQGGVTQTDTSGITKIDVISGGSAIVDSATGTPPDVTISIQAPRSGEGEAATAVAVIGRREAGSRVIQNLNSSTTIPIARTNPNKERLFKLKPSPAITENVPTIATGTATSGITVARQD